MVIGSNDFGWKLFEIAFPIIRWKPHTNYWWGGRNLCEEEAIYFSKKEVKCMSFWMFKVKDWKAHVLIVCLKCEFCIMLHTKLMSTFSSQENIVEKRVLKYFFWRL